MSSKSSFDFISLRQIERSYDLPPGSGKCFEVDPSREIGILTYRFDTPDQSCNDLSLFRIFCVKPSSQAAENGVCKGDYIYQIGETRITIHDDFQAVLLKEKTHARLNNSTYKLIILPSAAAFQAGKRENNETLPAENVDDYNVNIASVCFSPTPSDTSRDERKGNISSSNALSVRADKRPRGRMTSSMQQDPSFLPSSIGDGVSTVKAKNAKRNRKEPINYNNERLPTKSDNHVNHFAHVSPSPPSSDTSGSSIASLSDRILSKAKIVGSRVYARYINKQFYWGVIHMVATKRGAPHYSVRFEDGDFLEDIMECHLFSEFEYKQSTGKQPPPPSKQLSEGSESESVQSSPFDSEAFIKLYKRRCGKCFLCRKPDCRHCFTCKKGSRSRKEVCLQKICSIIGVEDKAQPVPGFPSGYKFLFEQPKQTSRFRGSSLPEAAAGLKFITPGGGVRYLGWIRNHREITIDTIDSFLMYVGMVSGEKHGLSGKDYRHEWMDILGTNKVVIGKVISCSIDWVDGCKNEKFTIKLVENSCDLAEQASLYSAKIPRIQKIPTRCAYGGVFSYNENLQKRPSTQESSNMIDEKIPPMICWLTPEMRLREVVTETGLPKLTLFFRGWKLEFSIKMSTIQNAGHGCFLRCTNLSIENGDLAEFFLRPGELLDLGVYAPFREEDKKLPCIFKLKNFVHSFEPEEWVFGSPDGMVEYDITEEATGKPHSIAQKNVYMYVNETLDPFPTIYAENDPEGFVHYLFGIEYDGDIDAFNEGMRKLNADIRGGEFEVFVYYGKEYEKVRKRKGYSTDSIGGEVDLSNDEEGFLKEVSEFEKEDVFAVLDYLSGPFFLDSNGQKVETLSESVKNRLQRVFHSLQTRIRCLVHSSRQSERCDLEVRSKLLDALRMKVYTSF